jgi:hypothetical protein
MRVADVVYVLPIPRGSRPAEGFLNLTLILDDENGNTLVDAGLPGQEEEISSALADAGIGVQDLGRVIFTRAGRTLPTTANTTAIVPASPAPPASGAWTGATTARRGPAASSPSPHLPGRR